MSAREAILKRLRGSRTDEVGKDASNVTNGPLPETSIEQRIQLFSDKMSSTRTEVHEVSWAGWSQCLLHLAREKGVNNLLYAAEVDSGVHIERTWSAAGDESSIPELVRVDAIADSWKFQMFNHVDAAVTSCRGGIAATGSLVLWPSQHEPRLMSLAPAIHFALLDAEKLYDSFAQMLATEQWVKAGMPANALLISGPSKTADIESTLAYGVHGPKQLIVLLLH
jgi:L-lactate dehydrogenase complex protein LldG